MDESVKQAMAKWPNVPHCYGWLALDARGRWRMRDARAQMLGLPGDVITHPALLAFINRNYLADERGCWYFQNGPQRVYVNLEATPYVARTDPAHGFVLHTQQPLAALDAVSITDTGNLLLEGEGKVALLDDRDVAECIANMRIDGAPATDDQLVEWLDQAENPADIVISCGGRKLALQRIATRAIPAHFGFTRMPAPEGG